VAAVAPPPPEPQGPTVEDLRAQMEELISQQSEMLQQQYDDKLIELQTELDAAQREAERRQRADDERKKQEAEAAAEAEAEQQAALEAEAQRQADEEAQRLAEEKKAKEAEAEKAKAAEATAKPAVPTPRPAVPTPTPKPAAGSAQTKPEPAAPKVRRGDLVEMGPGVIPPRQDRAPNPSYPAMARRFNKSNATVLVRALIDENGEVITVELASEPQKFGFDQEAMSAVKKSTYKPATKDGVPVKFWHTITVQFRK
jgi:TonB family protein